MGILDDLGKAAAAAGGFNVQSFGGSGSEAVWVQLRPWLAKISARGALKWLPRAAAQIPCQVPNYDQGIPVGACPHTSLENCLNCQRPVCLAHAFINEEAEALCYLCIVQMKESKPAQQRQAPPPHPDKRERAKQNTPWALGVLGLASGASWDDVHKRHRTLSAEFHPDRPGGDELRFKDVQNAYDTLKIVYGEN